MVEDAKTHMVNLDSYDGLLNATRAIMTGVAGGVFGHQQGGVLLRGVKMSLEILEAKKRRENGHNPLNVGPEHTTPDGPFAFRRKAPGG